MMTWDVVYHEKAERDLADLDKSVSVRVIKAINKVSKNPLPQSEGGYGKPLGNRQSSKLSGLLKIKLRSIGIRVVYQLIQNGSTMRVLVISIRDDNIVYKEAENRVDE